MSRHFFTKSRRKAKVGVALAIGAGLLAVPTAMPASADSTVTASAETGATIAGTALGGMNTTDPAALLAFETNFGLVVRTPAIAATAEQAEARNVEGSEPTLTCYEGVTTTAPAALTAPTIYSGKGYYASYEGSLVLNFYMDDVPTSAVDACVMLGTDFMPLPSKFVFTAAGAKAVHGDPTTLVNNAKAELNKVKTAAAKIYKKKGSFPRTNAVRNQLRKAMKTKSVYIRTEGQLVGSAGVPHLVRTEMTASKLTASVRIADGRLVTMSYNGKSKKTSFTTTPLIFESATKPSNTVVKNAMTPGLYFPRFFRVKSGTTARVPGFLYYNADAEGTKMYVSLRASRGTLFIESFQSPGQVVSVDEATKSFGVTLGYGYTAFSGTEFAFYGKPAEVNRALFQLRIAMPRETGAQLAQPVELTSIAFEHRDDVAFNPANQHFYKFVKYASTTTNADKTAVKAIAAAAESKELGLTGYLATITSAAENEFVGRKIYGASNIWINGSDSETESVWKYTSGPESGQVFWNGCGNRATPAGSAPAGAFASWNTNDSEPNNTIDWDRNNYCGGASYDVTVGAGEDCMVTNWNRPWIPVDFRVGYWNDLACDSPTDSAAVQGYLLEFGNKPIGGDFTGVEMKTTTISLEAPDPVAIAPNFFQKAATFLNKFFAPKKVKETAAAKKPTASPKKSSDFTLKHVMTIPKPGVYQIRVMRPGSVFPYTSTVMSAGTTVKIGKRTLFKKPKIVEIELSNSVVTITTTKANEQVEFVPRFREYLWGRRKSFFVEVSLKSPNGQPLNQASLSNWLYEGRFFP
jgi:hypothetical protein